MGSSMQSPVSILLPGSRFKLDCRSFRVSGSFDPIFVGNFHLSRSRRFGFRVSADGKFGSSWIPSNANSFDDYGGWSISEAQIEKKKAVSSFLYVGVGTSFAFLLAATIYSFSSSKGVKDHFNASLHALRGLFLPSSPMADTTKISETTPDKSNENYVPVAADSTQREALLVLKKLKIIEDHVKSDELCTRREYARWLVKANSLLERNPKHRIVPFACMSVAGSLVSAFDDVSVTDPDFVYIQALAEAGIVLSKLSATNLGCSNADGSECKWKVDFSPESFISRLDLISWKAKLEYLFSPGVEEKMSRKDVGFMDVGAMNGDASKELFTDMLTEDKSIVRKVFGYTRRFQPRKPATRAQAAVALTSGRVREAINAKLSSLEVENSLREAEKEEIKSEFLQKGEIHRVWEEKLSAEKACGLQVEEAFLIALRELEKEKLGREESHAEFLKEKAALDCQWQLLLTLKGEVDGMCERLTGERASFLAEQQSLEQLFVDLQVNQNTVAETKSTLEVEKDALQILRSWVEEEARRSQARAKVLEEAVKRWKWDDQFSISHSRLPENGEISKSLRN